MKKKFFFTPEQDIVIKNYVNLFSHNLNLGFELCSLELKCKLEQVQQRWYFKLRSEESVFVTGTPSSSYRNTKNVLRKKPRPEYKLNKHNLNLMAGTINFKKK